MDFFEPTDHLRHAPDASGKMRDSLFWQTIIPEEQLGFQAYLYLTASGKAGFNVLVWGADAKPLVADMVTGTVAADAQLDDFHFEGLHLTQTAMGAANRIAYRSGKVTLELDFTPRHAPFSYRANHGGLPAWFAVNRYEQTGWLTGHITIGDRRIAIDRMGHIDHSWGNRNWGVPQHWKWFVAYSPDGARMLNGWVWIARGEWGFGGYVVRDGVPVAIAEIAQHADYDEKMGQTRLEARISDVAGGVTELTMERFGIIRLPTGDPLGTVIHEAACTVQIDGIAGAGQFETHWQSAYIDHLAATGSTR